MWHVYHHLSKLALIFHSSIGIKTHYAECYPHTHKCIRMPLGSTYLVYLWGKFRNLYSLDFKRNDSIIQTLQTKINAWHSNCVYFIYIGSIPHDNFIERQTVLLVMYNTFPKINSIERIIGLIEICCQYMILYDENSLELLECSHQQHMQPMNQYTEMTCTNT